MSDFKFGKFCNTAFVIKTEKDRAAVIKRLDDFNCIKERPAKKRYFWLVDKSLPFKLFICNSWGCQYSSDIYFHHKDYKDIKLEEFLRNKGEFFEIE